MYIIRLVYTIRIVIYTIRRILFVYYTYCIIILFILQEVILMKKDIREKLETMSDRKNSTFSSKIVPGAKNILGVRLPVLREYAREIAKTEGLAALEGEDFYFDEVMLRGMVIGYVKITPEQRLLLMDDFVPRIDNWSVCDSICCTLKFPKKSKPLVWEHIQKYADSDKEFYQRYAAVMLLDHFVNDEYIDAVLETLTKINTDAYYSSMAVGWAVAECYTKFPEKTLPYLQNKSFDADTHNRAIGKLCDSLRIDAETKQMLKTLKRTV